jgi:hypothetical protein
MTYETNQLFVIVFAALIVIGFTVWLFAEQWTVSNKFIGKFTKVNDDEEEF